MAVDLLVAPVPIADLLGRFLLHEGTHTEAAASSGAVGPEFVAASVAFVGIVGGLVYWYFGKREWTR